MLLSLLTLEQLQHEKAFWQEAYNRLPVGDSREPLFWDLACQLSEACEKQPAKRE